MPELKDNFSTEKTVIIPAALSRPSLRLALPELTNKDTLEIIIKINKIEIDSITYKPDIYPEGTKLDPVLRLDIIESMKQANI